MTGLSLGKWANLGEGVENINWVIVMEITGVIGGVATLLGFMLAPMFWLGSKND